MSTQSFITEWDDLSRRERRWVRGAAYRGERQKDERMARLVKEYADVQLRRPWKRLVLVFLGLVVLQLIIAGALYPWVDEFIFDPWRAALVLPATVLLEFGLFRPNLRLAIGRNETYLAGFETPEGQTEPQEPSPAPEEPEPS